MTTVYFRASDYPSTAQLEVKAQGVSLKLKREPKVVKRMKKVDPMINDYGRQQTVFVVPLEQDAEVDRDAIIDALRDWWSVSTLSATMQGEGLQKAGEIMMYWETKKIRGVFDSTDLTEDVGRTDIFHGNIKFLEGKRKR